MVINEFGILADVGILASVGAFLRLFKKQFTKYLSASLLFFVVLELLLSYLPFDLFNMLWWFVHAPSVTLLGVDEIFERHGWLTSTIAHGADLLLWSCILAAVIALSGKRQLDGHN